MSLIVAIFLVVFSIIAHEMGHWVVLQRLRVPVKEFWLGLGPVIFRTGRFRVGMLPIGGCIFPEPDAFEKLKPRARMAVALGGPVGSAIYGLALLAAASMLPPSAGQDGLNSLALANFMIALFNLLPIPPLDGFHLVDSLLDHVGKPLSEKTKSLSYRLGNGLVYGLGFFVLAKFLM
jgi:membrane-associated protease RseP (regulator of RpoE activity)